MTAFAVPANLAFDSYTALVEAIEDWMDRSDLSGSAQVMIALAESRMRRELSPLFYESTDSVVVEAGIGTLPEDCDFLRHVFYGSASLREVSPEAGRDYGEGDTPAAYSLEANQLYIWPAVDATVTVAYQAKFAQLSKANASNNLLSEHPDLYFYGAMMFAEGYLANDSRAALFKALWDEAIASANRFFMRQRTKSMGYGRPRVVV